MKSHLDLMSDLSAHPWFGSLPLRDRKVMLNAAELLRLRPGEMLFRQGDAPGGFYALLSGTLKMSTLSEDGKEAILVVLESGTWFGEISLIDHQPRTHDATALGEAELLVLPNNVFQTLMQRTAFSQAIARMLAGRIRLLYGIVEDATLRSTRGRIARRLLLLAHAEERVLDAVAAAPMERFTPATIVTAAQLRADPPRASSRQRPRCARIARRHRSRSRGACRRTAVQRTARMGGARRLRDGRRRAPALRAAGGRVLLHVRDVAHARPRLVLVVADDERAGRRRDARPPSAHTITDQRGDGQATNGVEWQQE